MASDVTPFDALLLLSFGGPEQPDDVVPFLENVTRGRGIPRERLAQVGEHYFLFGGRSPINDQNRELLAALRASFDEAGIELPIYWGNRNWDPYLADTLREMTADGVQRAAVFTTSAYSSYSSCRQYRENLADAVAQVPGAPRLDKLRPYFNHPGFVEPVVDAVVRALDELPQQVRHGAHLVFVTHSVPEDMAATSGPPDARRAYEAQHRDVADVVAGRVRALTGHAHRHDLVYCSRSGAPSTPWLEPDVNDHLEELATDGVPAVVLIPVGFVSDHMEVIYDLDTEALATAQRLGLPAARAATSGTDPRFVTMVRDLLVERAAAERGEMPPRPTLGGLPPRPDRCPAGCCPNLRGERPALCGVGDEV
ncbi:ferrochelatase [Nocardioides seonyuensis]|uniref:Coproporphyrin III ferrochelatase n=1 Tax=Nocardioides seonyuensis TaxID=2518371 RepID=A0A4P7ILD8_9ACTN|nr:ferrochelatase [Nocardioides seonyuensis]QBX56911.1 ferrochelatase [Nocardioides seonyuensis]